MHMIRFGAGRGLGGLGFEGDVLQAAAQGLDLPAAHALLCQHQAQGLSQADMVSALTELLGSAPEHDDWLRDALDMATGWCQPAWRVYPEQ